MCFIKQVREVGISGGEGGREKQVQETEQGRGRSKGGDWRMKEMGWGEGAREVDRGEQEQGRTGCQAACP